MSSTLNWIYLNGSIENDFEIILLLLHINYQNI